MSNVSVDSFPLSLRLKNSSLPFSHTYWAHNLSKGCNLVIIKIVIILRDLTIPSFETILAPRLYDILTPIGHFSTDNWLSRRN